MNKNLILILLLITSWFAWPVQAQASNHLVVVVNKHNSVVQMNRSEIIDLFLGKYVAFPNGIKAIPVELNGQHSVKKQFYAQLVGMSLARINAYWSRLRFTGRTRSVVHQPNQQHIIEFISNNELAIGYIPHSMLTNNLKVVFEFNE